MQHPTELFQTSYSRRPSAGAEGIGQAIPGPTMAINAAASCEFTLSRSDPPECQVQRCIT